MSDKDKENVVMESDHLSESEQSFDKNDDVSSNEEMASRIDNRKDVKPKFYIGKDPGNKVTTDASSHKCSKASS